MAYQSIPLFNLTLLMLCGCLIEQSLLAAEGTEVHEDQEDLPAHQGHCYCPPEVRHTVV